MANKYDHTKSISYFDDEPLRHRSVTKRAHSNAEEIPMWPIITGLAILLIWAVNSLAPGALSFITGYSFVDSLMLDIIIGSLYSIFHNRKQQQNDMVEDILNNIAQEKAAERLKEETSPVDDFLSQNNSAFHS